MNIDPFQMTFEVEDKVKGSQQEFILPSSITWYNFQQKVAEALNISVKTTCNWFNPMSFYLTWFETHNIHILMGISLRPFCYWAVYYFSLQCNNDAILMPWLGYSNTMLGCWAATSDLHLTNQCSEATQDLYNCMRTTVHCSHHLPWYTSWTRSM